MNPSRCIHDNNVITLLTIIEYSIAKEIIYSSAQRIVILFSILSYKLYFLKHA